MYMLSKKFSIPKNKIKFLNDSDGYHYDVKPSPFKPRAGSALKIKKEKNFKESLMKLIKELKTNSSLG